MKKETSVWDAWKKFADTGSVGAYLVYRAVQEELKKRL